MRGFTQESFGAASGVSVKTIIRAEAGRTTIRASTFRRIIDALGVPPVALCDPAQVTEFLAGRPAETPSRVASKPRPGSGSTCFVATTGDGLFVVEGSIREVRRPTEEHPHPPHNNAI